MTNQFVLRMTLSATMCALGSLGVALSVNQQRVDGQVPAQSPVGSVPGNGQVPTPSQVGPMIHGIQMTTRLEQQGKVLFAPMQPIVLLVTVRNTTAKPIGYMERGGGPDFTVVVQTQEGKVMPLTRYGSLLNSPTAATAISSLAPGAGKQFRLIANRQADMTLNGVYLITLKRFFGGGGGESVDGQSNTIEVVVGEPYSDVGTVIR